MCHCPDDELLQRKSNRHLLESINVRMDRVLAFLKLFRPGLVYDVVPINDVYGPTAVDPNIQALVVSKETMKGASSSGSLEPVVRRSANHHEVAAYRKERDLPPLQLFVIGVISAESAELDVDDIEMLMKTKLSSTFIREWIEKNSTKGISKEEE